MADYDWDEPDYGPGITQQQNFQNNSTHGNNLNQYSSGSQNDRNNTYGNRENNRNNDEVFRRQKNDSSEYRNESNTKRFGGQDNRGLSEIIGVNENLLGAIIGRGGAKIKELQSTSNAHIKIGELIALNLILIFLFMLHYYYA